MSITTINFSIKVVYHITQLTLLSYELIISKCDELKKLAHKEEQLRYTKLGQLKEMFS